MTKKSGKTILSFTTWLVNEFFSSSHFDAIKTFKYWFPQNRWFYKQRNFFKMMLEFRKDWKDLALVGRYSLLNGSFLQHLPTKVLHLNVPLMMSVPELSSKMLKDLKNKAFVGRYDLPNGLFLQHLPTKVLHLIVALTGHSLSERSQR